MQMFAHTAKDLQQQYRNVNLDSIPWFRRPKRRHIVNMMPAARRRHRLHRDPFIAFDILQELHLDKTFGYALHHGLSLY